MAYTREYGRSGRVTGTSCLNYHLGKVKGRNEPACDGVTEREEGRGGGGRGRLCASSYPYLY